MDGTITPETDYVAGLAGLLGRSWPAIAAAQKSAIEVQDLLTKSLSQEFGAFSSGDIDVFAYGSLARREWTSGSDIDWTLLIDGQATPDHRKVAREIGTKISQTAYRGENLRLPSSEGIFGNMAFSHDIIHHIGGQADTNRNTTQRVLLLLEAFPIRHPGYANELGPYERVARNILFRYLHDDTNFVSQGDSASRIPRFLLNDIVRYWRTMCVDFAYKEWEQAGGKWALRNVKLRMSRKLLFVSALLMVFSCYRNQSLKIDGPQHQYIPTMQGHLMRFVRSTPLNIVVWSLQGLGFSKVAGELLDHYDEFLRRLNDKTIIINDETTRTHLEKLKPDHAYQDPIFLEIREISHKFQTCLDTVFFGESSELREFTVKYGVF